jgi:integrase
LIIQGKTKENNIIGNRKKIRSSTTSNYLYVYRALEEFSKDKQFELRLITLKSNGKRELDSAQKYWKKFYLEFTDFLYKEKDYFDNYVGLIIKSLRTFFAYLRTEKNLNIGNFYRNFYVPKEEIPIIALSPEQLKYLIYSVELEETLPLRLHLIKDVFVFGCTVCLRVSDLLALKKQNLECINGDYYLNVRSQKTSTFTSIKLPDYAVAILKKHQNDSQNLFPQISREKFRMSIKEMSRHLNYGETIIKTRSKRGVAQILFKDKIKKQHYTLGDLISTHTMRRTGITTLLRMGMPDYIVRKISGHSANSREFFRYVQLAQSFLDQHTDAVFEKLKNLK